MRKWLLALSLLLCFYLDNVLFPLLSRYGLHPDMALALVVSLGVLAGPFAGGAAGFFMGLLSDLFFGKIVGLTGLALMLSGAAAGFFYRKFYADNLIIPTAAAMICSFLKEHMFLIAAAAVGAHPPYFRTLATYILPCLLLTGGVCTLMHLFFKHNLYRPLWRKEAIDL
ncbi:MAG: rod shape-determining protein MreD [Clostridia bacterium]|nr:rod shape-determining protein MreD [Clostridia bacterium]MBQ2517637.1 rod shape-determining protein MreD [Clostridia bacterium]MBQ4341622.1 rod shape-determining protein MreD [Clostridia bacterium]